MAFANREENQQLPPKVTNAGRATFAQNVNVLMNSYQLDIKQMVPQVFQYELRFIGERTFTRKDNQPEKKLQDLATGPRNDVSKETRRRLLWLLFQQLITQHADFFGTEKRNFTFDCALLLFSVKPLITDKKQRKFPMDVNRASLEDRCRDYISRNETITATLTPTGIVNLRDAPAAYIRGDRSVVQFLELLSSQRIYEQGGHYCFGNRMYEKDSVIQLQGDPRILKNGLQKNVRFVGENVQNAQPILQIDPKKSAFQPSVELLQFLCAFCGCSPQQLEQNIGNYFERIRKQTKGLVLTTTHLHNQVQFTATDLTQMPARDITFDRQGVQVSVPDHYQQTYQMRLHFPGLPCVIHRKPGAPGQNRPNDSHYPMEILHILPGQRVPIDKQTPKLTEQMIRQCQVLPADLPAQIDQQRDAAMVQSGNPFFKQHGLRVDANQMRLEAQVLFPPAIQYNPPQDRVEPDRTGKLEWRTVGRDVPQQRAYTAPAAWPTRWAVVIVQNCVTMQQCEQFCKQLVNIARSRGIGDAGLPPRVDHFEDTTTEFVRDKFEFYRNHKCTFVLAFAPGKRDAYPGDIHHTLKYCEQQFDVLTLHISPEIMGKGSGGGGGAIMVLENILMKLNLKLGGANWNLVTPVAYKQAARNQADIFGDVWLNGNKRMFIGIDFSHAPPQTIFERQAGKTPSIPSIVGMAYTVDKFMLRMRGTYWCQQTRQTTMVAAHQRPFVEHLKEAISLYMATNNAWPEHLIVFRAGISEGEFQRISFWEGQAFCKAFEHLAARGGNFQPPAVTILVCQRRSNYRMIPTNINRQAKAPDQNVQPGTVLDKGAMSAACTDFLLIPHKALQGTAQPTRCTVVHEWRPETGPAARIPPQLPVEELENITNSLCYSHGICAMPTAVPGVLYAGEELAKRGRNNWKMHTADGRQVPHFDLPPLGQEGDAALQAQLQLDKQRAEHNAHVSGELNPTVPTKFWA